MWNVSVFLVELPDQLAITPELVVLATGAAELFNVSEGIVIAKPVNKQTTKANLNAPDIVKLNTPCNRLFVSVRTKQKNSLS